MACIEDKTRGEVEQWSDPVWPFPRTSFIPFSLELQSQEGCSGCTAGENLWRLQELAAGDIQSLAAASPEIS